MQFSVMGRQFTNWYRRVSGNLGRILCSLTFGLYWKRATTQGALLSILLGIGCWVPFMFAPHLSPYLPFLDGH